MKDKKKQIALILNLIIVLSEIVGFIISFARHGIIIMGLYTQESNFVLLLSSLFYILVSLRHKEEPLPRWAALWRYIGTCLVSVTFFVVLFVLVPMCVPYGVEACLKVVFDGANFFHHFLDPILALVSFFGFEFDLLPGKKESIYALLPTLLYAIVTTSLNVAKVIKGPYPFLYVYEQPVLASVFWFFAIPGFGFGFAYLVGYIKRKTFKE